MKLSLLRRLSVLAAFCTPPFLTSCNQPGCDGLHEPSRADSAPILLKVELVEQRSENPWAMVFAVSFRDSDGDLGDGAIDIFSGANTPAQISLKSYVEASALSKSATSGRFGLPLTLAQGGVADDTTLRLGFQLRDAAGHFSNCYSLEMHFDVSLADGAGGKTSIGQDILNGLETSRSLGHLGLGGPVEITPVTCGDSISYGWSTK